MENSERVLYLVLTVISAIVSWLGGPKGIKELFVAGLNRRKVDAEAEKLRAEAAEIEERTSGFVIDNLKEELKRVKAEQAEMRLQVGRFAEELSEVKKQNQALQQTLSLALERINEVEQEKSDLLLRVVELEKRDQESQAHIRRLLERIGELENERERLLERIGELERCLGERMK